ncbi:MAG: hypothetical protein NZ519_03090 [Bacteroidia bacterium]|nr:hypothetical protein [Bacteroidia bacterium]MDW8301516.1 hypothetical protein [Bacteroidia bacterium]
MLICKIKINEPFAKLFATTTIGSILWVWLVALVRTQGLTIMNAGWVPAVTILLYLHKKNLQTKIETQIKFQVHYSHWIWISAILVFTIINYLYNLGLSFSHISTDNIDTIYYVRLSEFIYRTGIESTNIDYFQIKPNYPNPYHYFTPWLQAGFNAIFDIENRYLARSVVIFSIYFANFYVGLLAILKKLVKNETLHYYHFLTPLLFFFIKPIGLGNLTAHIYGSYTLYWINSLIQLPKHSPIVMILIAFVLLSQSRQYVLAMIILLFLPILYITTAPAIAIILICLLIWAWSGKIVNQSAIYYTILPALCAALYCILFYAFYPTENYIVSPVGIPKPFWERFYDNSFLIILTKDIIQILFVFSLSLSPLILLSFIYLKSIKAHINAKEYRNYLFYFVNVSIVSSILAWQILYYIWDSEQFFACIAAPLYMLVVFLWINLLIEIGTTKPKWIRTCTITIILGYGAALLYSAIHTSAVQINKYKATYSPEYVAYINKNKNRFSEYGGVLVENNYIWYLYFHTFPKPYIQNKKPYDFLALNIFELKLQPNFLDQQYIKLFPFYQFVEKQKKEGTFVNLSQSKLDFIKKFHINHIVANKNTVLDSIFLPYVQEQYVDKYSGQRLYFLSIP